MLALFLSVVLQSCWGASASATVVAPVVRQSVAAYEWVKGPTQWHLYRGVKQAGSFVDGRYHPFVNGNHQAAAPLPADAPPCPSGKECECCTDCECTKDDKGLCPCPSGKICNTGCRCVLPDAPKLIGQTEPTNFGIDVAKWKAEAHAGRGYAPPPDDSDKCRLTVIGTDAERKAVMDDLARGGPLATAAGKCVVNGYPPDHWAVTSAGFKATGHPTIYYQSATGRVLHRQDDYDGPTRLAEAIRRADPAYDPSKDPDRRADPAPAPTPTPDVPPAPAPALPDWLSPSNWPAWVWAVVGVAGVSMLRGLASKLGGIPGWLLDLLANRLEKRLASKDKPEAVAPKTKPAPKEERPWTL